LIQQFITAHALDPDEVFSRLEKQGRVANLLGPMII
jgi:hypothetical protein